MAEHREIPACTGRECLPDRSNLSDRVSTFRGDRKGPDVVTPRGRAAFIAGG